MPAPGDQHLNNIIVNPFEEIKPRISEYTAQEIATISHRLDRQLGPEYISTRPGPGGQKIHYITGEKCIQLANEVFGFNGWSSSIVNVQVDTVEENPTTKKISLGLSVIVRVTLRDGTYHEDIGYGDIDNCKGKAAAFNKAKKEATTDALKRALRNFGNVLGNCMYNKDYLTKVMKVKVAPSKWDANELHRHADYVQIRKEVEVPVTAMENAKANDFSDLTSFNCLEDEFGDFDDADFGVSHDPDFHPDGVLLPANILSRRFSAGTSADVSVPAVAGNSGAENSKVTDLAQTTPAQSRTTNGIQSAETDSGRNGQQSQQLHASNTGPIRNISGSNAGGQMRVHPEANNSVRPIQAVPTGPGRVLNQPNRMGTASAPLSPVQQSKTIYGSGDENTQNQQPPLEVGFFSARAATMLPEVINLDRPMPLPPRNLPTFNPHAESPSIRRTPGVDHSVTKPLSKDLRPISGAAQALGSPAPLGANIANPQLNATRRIGAPSSPSPMANRGSYKPPTMKRPHQTPNSVRPPLGDIPANGTVSLPEGGGDVKRPRLSGS